MARWFLDEIQLVKPSPGLAGGAGCINQLTAPGVSLVYDTDAHAVVITYHGRKDLVPWPHVLRATVSQEAPVKPKA